jgi:predicted DNA-binding transcriptional regulator AlpA
VDSETAAIERLYIREAEVIARYGVPRTGLFRMMRDEGMPQPIRLTGRRKAWKLAELDDYFANRPRGIAPCSGTGQFTEKKLESWQRKRAETIAAKSND